MILKRVLTVAAILTVVFFVYFTGGKRRNSHSEKAITKNTHKIQQPVSLPFAAAVLTSNHLGTWEKHLPAQAQNESLQNLASAWNSTNAEPATARFTVWWEKYSKASAHEKIALEKEGRILASERRVALKSLIQSDPERALENAVPFAVRRELPDSIKTLLEERISGRGDLDVFGVLAEPGKESEVAPTFRTAKINGREFKAFAYGRRLGEPTKRGIPLNGIAVENFFAVNENPVRILEKAEADEIPRSSETVCSVSGDSANVNQEETALDVGGEILFVCKIAHASFLNDQLIAAADVAASSRTEGEKKLILIRVDFPDSGSSLEGPPFSNSTGTNLIAGLNAFYIESSYRRTSFALVGQGSDYTPTFRMPHPAAYYGDNDYFAQLRSDARAAASAAGYVLSDYDYDLICMGPVPGFNWAGLGYVGAAGAWIRNSFGTGVSAHELGHNYGLNHANFWDTRGASTIGSPGTNVEYGDIFDTMGSAAAGNNHFNVRNKRLLNWVRTNEIVTVTSGGTFRIYRQDDVNSIGIRGLSIAKNSSTNYWVEFRQKFTGNKWLMNGVGLRWAPNGNKQSMLLDTTPGSPDGKNDSAIVIGRTFSDPQAGIHITPIRKGGTTPESIDVVVNRGTFPGNVPPTISISASATSVSPGTTVHFTATANDANGDALAYYWDFGDRNFGTNGPTASKSWSSTREYIVRCTASDMKGGVASDSIIVRVGSPITYRISGQVKDLNAPVEGVRVYLSNSSTLMTYTDSDGTYNIVGVPGGNYTVNAQLDGYTFYRIFSNPVSVGPSATEIDFNTAPIVPPLIFAQPQSLSVAAGLNVAFSVSASGDSLRYQWQFNGIPMVNRTNSSITLTNVQLADAGNYAVVVSNTGSSVTSSNAMLVVNVPPIMPSIPNQTVSEGNLLSFAVSASDSANDVTNLISDFDEFQQGTPSVMFRAPNYSPTTATNLDGVPNLLTITTNPPGGLQNNQASLNASWSFKSGIANPWLRLTTFAANRLPNPTIDFSHHLRFKIYSDKALKVAAGLRETDSTAPIGEDGGNIGGIEFVGVSNVVNGTPFPIRSVPPNVWTTVDLDLQNDPVMSFSGGNGILESSTGKGAFEHLCFAPEEGSGAYNVYLDNFEDVDASRLTYSLEPGAPEGASIDPQTGMFSWTPGEMQGPGVYEITVRVKDDGKPMLSTTRSFSVTVTESNNPPVLAAISNQFVSAGATLTFTNSASDPDWPANVLSFSFGSNTLAGATIDSGSGVFNWTAPESGILITNIVTVSVTDDGLPPQSDSRDFQIVVVPPFRASAEVSATDDSIVFSWPAFPGKTYQLQYKNDLSETNWTNLGDTITGQGGNISVTNTPSEQAHRFFRILLLN